VDIELNELGRAQAQQLATRLALEHRRAPFAAAYSSDLVRARATAECAIAPLGLPLQLRAGLRERNFGVLAAMTRAEMGARHPAIVAAWQADLVDYVIPEGESHAAFSARVLGTLRELSAAHDGPVLVVTHGGSLDCVYRAATGLHLDIRREDPIPNASISRVRVTAARFEIERWGEPAQ
jgi:probable phosphoglycerate mutase